MEPNPKANRGVSMECLGWNTMKMDSFCAIMYITAGIVSGILGLTGMNGLFLFIAAALAMNAALFVKMGFCLEEYSNAPLLSFLTLGAKSHCMSYVLFWTLFYALVHIY
jgi:hypothetical protein